MPSPKRERQRAGQQARREALLAQQKRARQRKMLIRYGAILAVVAIIVALVVLTSGGSKKSNVSTTATTAGTATTAAAGGPPKATPVPAGAKLATWACPKPDGSSPRTDSFPSTPPPMCIDPSKTYVAKLDTTLGEVDVTLDTKKTPNTANNYAVLSEYHYYDGTSIDRIDTSIDILQTGSPKTQDITDPGPGYNIKDEGKGFTYADGDVVMARGSGADSGSSQYFFVVGAKAAGLNSQGTYVTFGHVTKGLDILHQVEGLFQACAPSDQSCLGGAPSKVVTITKITISES